MQGFFNVFFYTQNLEWRKENDMENILNEDWSDFESNYPIELQGCDKEGRPGKILFLRINV